jgi:predicted ATPase/class 3 adenylate cyclase
VTAATLPGGDVTFLFVTAETEPGFAETRPDEFKSLLDLYDSALRNAITANGGFVFESVGDAIYAAFADPARAAIAALDAQRRIVPAVADVPGRLTARVGIHTGYAQPQGDHYIGAPLYRCARIMAVGHGSQILLSATTAARVGAALPPAATLRSLGTHRLKDLAEPEHIFQLRHPELPSEFPPLKSLSVLLNNLPNQLTTFVGRDKEIADISRLLLAARLVTLLGPGGVGKTRLSIQVAADMIDTYADGVWLVELAAIVDPELVTQQVASALGIREEPNRLLIETLLTVAGSKSLLLVLDNCEHLLDACATLTTRMLATCPDVRILATSREKLGHAEEVAWPVPPLRVPDPSIETAGAVRDYESVRLFADRAMSVQPAFAITDRNAAAIGQICQQLDGIPLAIELAAARVNVLTIDQLASRILDRFHLLTRGSRAALPRQQTLRAVIDWSYELLEGDERRLFSRLAVFLGGWTIDAARPVCAWDGLHADNMEDALRRLSEKSLTVEERAGGVLRRYRMLETLRQYASERLSESGEAEKTQQEHADFFVRLGEAAEPQLTGPQQQAWLETLDTEHDNLRAVLRWAEMAARGDVGCRLGGALWRYWSVRGLFSEGRDRLNAILALTPERTPARAKALHGAGVLATQTGAYAAARGLYEESLEIRRDLGDRVGVANTLSNLGIVCRWLGEVGPARMLYEESLGIRRDLGDQWGIATSLNLLGLLVHYEGDLAQARALLEESLRIRRELGDRWTIANSLNNLGLVLLDQGDYVAARTLYRESLGIARELGDKWAIAFLYEAFAGLAAAEGEAGRALLLAGAAEALREVIGSPLSPADKATLERKLEPASRALPAEEQASWGSRGRSMTVDEASDFALSG